VVHEGWQIARFFLLLGLALVGVVVFLGRCA
jgi:hypothetical protein